MDKELRKTLAELKGMIEALAMRSANTQTLMDRLNQVERVIQAGHRDLLARSTIIVKQSEPDEKKPRNVKPRKTKPKEIEKPKKPWHFRWWHFRP